MPSPGRTATFTLEVPGELRLSLRLEGADLVRVAQREADLVQAVQQAVPAERIDLERQSVSTLDGVKNFRFDIEPFRKHCLLNGLDEIGLTLRHAEEIRAFEARRKTQFPWYF